MSSMVSDDAPRPRLCHLKKWEDFNGYGFNLHAEKGTSGQFIGKIDPNSPAEAAGLKEKDRIVEVNGTNIGNENHGQVVQRVKAVPNETKLLVVDSTTDAYYKEKKIVIRGDMPNVQVNTCPDTSSGAKPQMNGSATSEDTAFKPRLCHLKIVPTFEGYGFNLHAEKNKPGQFIGKVDEGSPAATAGLKDGDRILEVNGSDVTSQTHADVVTKVKAVRGETKLLVIDAEADAFLKDKGIKPTAAMAVSGSAPTVAESASEDAPKLRLCHLKIWPDFQGYGFNLHAEKDKPGQFIGKVDEGSPAEAAGLQEGDKIIEINGEDTTSVDHAGAVSRIKSVPNETKLLVADATTLAYYNEKNITMSSSSTAFVTHECPDSKSGGGVAVAAVAAVAAAAVVTSTTSDDGPSPRLCHVKIWPDFQGYGFNLHAEKGKPGQYIGKVDEGSPSEAAGLKEGDRIIEVNGENVEGSTHGDVVTKIKAVQGETKLLVVDSETDKYYKDKDTAITGGMAQVAVITCPDTKTSTAQVNGQVTEAEVIPEPKDEPQVNHVEEATPEVNKEGELAAQAIADIAEEEARKSEEPAVEEQKAEEVSQAQKDDDDALAAAAAAAVVVAAASEEKKEEPKVEAPRAESHIYEEVEVTPEPAKAPEPAPAKAPEPEPAKEPEPEAAAEPTTPTSPSQKAAVINGIEFPASVAEMRERMSSRKKTRNDPKNASMGIKEKYDLFQKL